MSGPTPQRFTGVFDDGGLFHGGPHDGVPCMVKQKVGSEVAVDAEGSQHGLYGEWAPHLPPFHLYRCYQYGVADDPARPGVWRFWLEWHYTKTVEALPHYLYVP